MASPLPGLGRRGIGHVPPFSTDGKKRNFEFYDPLTTGDSSPSSCVEAIIAAEVGDIDNQLGTGWRHY
jgi:trehalose/maltose hydrolase-like predicted phosphorylase